MKNACILVIFAVLIAFSALIPACAPQMPERAMKGGSFPEAGPKAVEGGMQFVIFVPKAKRVNIVGDFNGWSTSADPMFNRGEKGIWTITLPLQTGRYEHKFLIDGEKWIPDQGNPEKVKDGFGAFNSVVKVGP